MPGRVFVKCLVDRSNLDPNSNRQMWQKDLDPALPLPRRGDNVCRQFKPDFQHQINALDTVKDCIFCLETNEYIVYIGEQEFENSTQLDDYRNNYMSDWNSM